MNFFDELQNVILALETRAIDYALCGGVALAIHGAPRATQGIDLLLRPEDIDALRAVARNCGFTLESIPMDFASGLTIQRFTKLIGSEPLMLDVLFVAGALEKVWADRQILPFQGGQVRVVSRDGLIALKLAAGRPQDVADIKRLEELAVVDMSAAAVTLRLREIDHLLAKQGLRKKGVDMSAAAVTARLQTMGSLSDMCLRLVTIGLPLRGR